MVTHKDVANLMLFMKVNPHCCKKKSGLKENYFDVTVKSQQFFRNTPFHFPLNERFKITNDKN